MEVLERFTFEQSVNWPPASLNPLFHGHVFYKCPALYINVSYA